MNTKLQELTEKIYQEGVEKGQTEATAIVEQAKAVAAGITAKAEEEAAAILASATEKAVELSRNTKAELQLFANQIVNALKTEIMNLVCGEVVSEAVTAAATDKDFMQQVMLTFVKNMATDEGVTIEALQAEKLTAYFIAASGSAEASGGILV